ncbi:hypothetical protein ECN1_1185 [Escherichia coli N1]|nr:hypothetical protein ECN1_1185 [Escherichia coli N1]EYE05850.1 hypothetical protein AC80_1461 [Escherichia coli 1-110-08_S4_C1]KEJ17274.1 hypothetical protein AB50_1394 [Escherichia coli 6-175-07_S1_C2]
MAPPLSIRVASALAFVKTDIVPLSLIIVPVEIPPSLIVWLPPLMTVLLACP